MYVCTYVCIYRYVYIYTLCVYLCLYIERGICIYRERVLINGDRWTSSIHHRKIGVQIKGNWWGLRKFLNLREC